MYRLLLYPRLFFPLPPTVNVIHVRCGLTSTPATVKMNILLPSLRRFISAEQTSQRSSAEWDCSDLPVIKAHPGPDPRDERKKVRELGGGCSYLIYI